MNKTVRKKSLKIELPNNFNRNSARTLYKNTHFWKHSTNICFTSLWVLKLFCKMNIVPLEITLPNIRKRSSTRVEDLTTVSKKKLEFSIPLATEVTRSFKLTSHNRLDRVKSENHPSQKSPRNEKEMIMVTTILHCWNNRIPLLLSDDVDTVRLLLRMIPDKTAFTFFQRESFATILQIYFQI